MPLSSMFQKREKLNFLTVVPSRIAFNASKRATIRARCLKMRKRSDVLRWTPTAIVAFAKNCHWSKHNTQNYPQYIRISLYEQYIEKMPMTMGDMRSKYPSDGSRLPE